MRIKHQVWWVEDGPEGLHEVTETFATFSGAAKRLDELTVNPMCITADLVEVRISKAWVKSTPREQPPQQEKAA